jgi:hypothetical protein
MIRLTILLKDADEILPGFKGGWCSRGKQKKSYSQDCFGRYNLYLNILCFRQSN